MRGTLRGYLRYLESKILRFDNWSHHPHLLAFIWAKHVLVTSWLDHLDFRFWKCGPEFLEIFTTYQPDARDFGRVPEVLIVQNFEIWQLISSPTFTSFHMSKHVLVASWLDLLDFWVWKCGMEILEFILQYYYTRITFETDVQIQKTRPVRSISFYQCIPKKKFQSDWTIFSILREI